MAGTTLSIAAVFLATTVYGYCISVPQAELLPEVALIVQGAEIEKDQVTLNGYAATFGIDAPVGIDFVALGEQRFGHLRQRALNALHERNYAMLEEAVPDVLPRDDRRRLAPPMRAEISPRLSFACVDLNNHECIADVVAERLVWQEQFERNAVLSARYEYVMQLPYWHTSMYAVSDPAPPLGYLLQMSQLRLAQAVVLMNDDQVGEAIDLISREIAFYRKMRSGRGDLLNHTVAVRGLFTAYHTLEQLLEAENMYAYLGDERLVALMQPLSLEEQRIMAEVLKAERNRMLYMLYTIPSTMGASERLFYDQNDTCNLAYRRYEPMIAHGAMTMAEASQHYLSGLAGNNTITKADKEEAGYWACVLQQKDHFLANWIGSVLGCTVPIDYKKYLYRDYHLQVYMALVRLKYELARHDIPFENISDFLSQENEFARNPYTQAFFEWDSQHQLLSTPWIHRRASFAQRGTHMSVRVNRK